MIFKVCIDEIIFDVCVCEMIIDMVMDECEREFVCVACKTRQQFVQLILKALSRCLARNCCEYLQIQIIVLCIC